MVKTGQWPPGQPRRWHGTHAREPFVAQAGEGGRQGRLAVEGPAGVRGLLFGEAARLQQVQQADG